MSLRTRDICESMAMRLLWEYTSTDCTVHDSVCKTVYSENSLKFSILVKMLHIFRHNTDYVIYSGVCSAACLSATVLHDLLRDKFLVS